MNQEPEVSSRELVEQSGKLERRARRVARQRPTVGGIERFVGVMGGGALSAYGLRLYGRRKRASAAAVALAAAGAGLVARSLLPREQRSRVWRMLTGKGERSSANGRGTIEVHRSVAIDRPAEELFQFFRDFQNLPLFMEHLESVRVGANGTWQWVARGPARTRVAWVAEIVNEEENRLLAWRSLEDADVASAGCVRFEPLRSGGTVVRVDLSYHPPGGRLGAAVAKLFGEAPDQQIDDDLRRFKQLMETGEIPTIAGQPSAS